MNVHEALSYLENLCQSADTSEGPKSNIFSAGVCIQPLDNNQAESNRFR